MILRKLAFALSAALIVASCAGGEAAPVSAPDQPDDTAPATGPAPGTDTDVTEAAAPDVPECDPEHEGPRGETPTRAESLEVSEEVAQTLRDSGETFEVATFWQVQADTGDLMMQGMAETWEELDLPIQLGNATYADWDAATQVSQIQTLVAAQPDALVGILVDPSTGATAIQAANEAGIPVIFWDLPAEGEDFASIVSATGKLAGCRAADTLAKAIGYEGEIASLPMKFEFFPTDQRVEGFNDRIAEAYPDIEIVSDQGATVFEDGQDVGEGLLQAHPDLKGVFASWQDPAMGVVAAAQAHGRTDLAVTTVDLSDVAAHEIANCGVLVGTAATLPYDEGVAEAKLVANILAGEEVPEFVIADTPMVTHDNVLEGYTEVFHEDPPASLMDAYVEECDWADR